MVAEALKQQSNKVLKAPGSKMLSKVCLAVLRLESDSFQQNNPMVVEH